MKVVSEKTLREVLVKGVDPIASIITTAGTYVPMFILYAPEAGVKVIPAIWTGDANKYACLHWLQRKAVELRAEWAFWGAEAWSAEASFDATGAVVRARDNAARIETIQAAVQRASDGLGVTAWAQILRDPTGKVRGLGPWTYSPRLVPIHGAMQVFPQPGA